MRTQRAAIEAADEGSQKAAAAAPAAPSAATHDLEGISLALVAALATAFHANGGAAATGLSAGASVASGFWGSYGAFRAALAGLVTCCLSASGYQVLLYVAYLPCCKAHVCALSIYMHAPGCMLSKLICSGSDMYGDTRYGDLDPHTSCQQVKQWPPAWASAAWAWAYLPQLPRGLTSSGQASSQQLELGKRTESFEHLLVLQQHGIP
eukprot:364792-Chlamydomonas_euryale.AAC.9